MTGDDHGSGGTAGRFDQLKVSEPAGLLVATGSACAAPRTSTPRRRSPTPRRPPTRPQGFEVGAPRRTPAARDWTPQPRSSVYDGQLAGFAARLPEPAGADDATGRTASPGATRRRSRRSSSSTASGSTRTTTTGPASGCRTGPACSPARACRCASPTVDGSMIDVYQAATQMTDESAQTLPAHDRHAARQRDRRRGLLRRLHGQHAHRRRRPRRRGRRSSRRRRPAACRSSRRGRC